MSRVDCKLRETLENLINKANLSMINPARSLPASHALRGIHEKGLNN